jgi:hypothetical protein
MSKATSAQAERKKMLVRVDSYADRLGVRMPCRFRLDGRHIDVIETLDQWHGSDCRYVKVRGHDGGLYILRYDEMQSEWELTMFANVRAQAFPTK